MFLVLLTEVDHWKEEGDDTQLPQVNTDFILTSVLWIGEINSLAQGHSTDESWSEGKFYKLGFSGHA